MKKFAVIGKDVSKSLSPLIHRFLSENTGNKLIYDSVSVSEDEFDGRAEKLFFEYDGLNVTIPFKLKIIPYLSKLYGDAAVFGAVNTVKTDGRTGYNTDGEGFMLMLGSNGVETAGKDFLVLGAGGAGRSVAKKLSDAGATVCVYDTRTESALKISREFPSVKVAACPDPVKRYAVVNATGIGMHLTEGISPVGEDVLNLCDIAIDLIYEPAKSAFLQTAERCGKRIINGLAMLFYQAYYAHCIFFGDTADGQRAKRLYNKFTEEVV